MPVHLQGRQWLGDRCIALPLQVQDSDKTKLEVHGSVRASMVKG